MWLQHKQKMAALANVRLDPATVSHDTALRGLVATAKGVKDPLKPTFLEPVARMGAGRFLKTHSGFDVKLRCQGRRYQSLNASRSRLLRCC